MNSLQFKEKSIAPQFLGQFFGEGLGYQVKTASPDDWQMEYEFYVKDVGTADAALGQFPRAQACRWRWSNSRAR